MNKAAAIFARTARAVFKPVPKLRVWQWLDKHVRIPLVTGSREPGPLKTSRIPPMRGLYELYWERGCHFFTLCKSARVGGTLFAICCVLHKIATWPGPILWVDPSRKSGQRFSRAELQPHMMDCPPVTRQAILDKEHFTVGEMFFKGGSTVGVVGAGSAVELGGRQGEMVVLNESDKIRHTIKGEAPPDKLAEARSKQFIHTRKILRNSTPTTEDGPTYTQFRKGSRHYCYLPCPHCSDAPTPGWKPPADHPPGHSPLSHQPGLRGWQRLTFHVQEEEVPFDVDGQPLPGNEKRLERTGRFKFDHCRIFRDKVDPQTGETERIEVGFDLERVERETVYECAHCSRDIEEADLQWMLDRYQWRAHNRHAPKDHTSAHFWAAYNPFESWGALAKKFVQCGRNPGLLHDFYNNDLGLPFVRQATTVNESDIERLQKASPEYLLRQIPYRPELLTMTVDVQGNGFWWEIWAWGILWDLPGEPTFAALVDYGQAVNWDQIKEYAGLTPDSKGKHLRYKWRDPLTGEVHEYCVTAGLVDSGDQAQSEANVYAFCLANAAVFSPSKGGGRTQLRGETIRVSSVFNAQLELVWYWDDLFKQELYYASIKERTNHRFLPRDLCPQFIEQLTDEHTEPDGQGKLQWVGKQGGKATNNHLGDCWKMTEVLAGTVEERLDLCRVAAAQEREAALAAEAKHAN